MNVRQLTLGFPVAAKGILFEPDERKKERIFMAYRCAICGKGVLSGKTISHSHRKTLRRFSPNLQRVKIQLPSGPRREYVCTSCLKSGRVRKAP